MRTEHAFHWLRQMNWAPGRQTNAIEFILALFFKKNGEFKKIRGVQTVFWGSLQRARIRPFQGRAARNGKGGGVPFVWETKAQNKRNCVCPKINANGQLTPAKSGVATRSGRTAVVPFDAFTKKKSPRSRSRSPSNGLRDLDLGLNGPVYGQISLCATKNSDTHNTNMLL